MATREPLSPLPAGRLASSGHVVPDVLAAAPGAAQGPKRKLTGAGRRIGRFRTDGTALDSDQDVARRRYFALELVARLRARGHVDDERAEWLRSVIGDDGRLDPIAVEWAKRRTTMISLALHAAPVDAEARRIRRDVLAGNDRGMERIGVRRVSDRPHDRGGAERTTNRSPRPLVARRPRSRSRSPGRLSSSDADSPNLAARGRGGRP